MVKMRFLPRSFGAMTQLVCVIESRKEKSDEFFQEEQMREETPITNVLLGSAGRMD